MIMQHLKDLGVFTFIDFDCISFTDLYTLVKNYSNMTETITWDGSVHLLAVINQNETLYIKRKAHSIFEIRNTTIEILV